MKIGRLRKKLKNDKFLVAMFEKLAKEGEYLNAFRDMECFGSSKRAKSNLKTYNTEIKKVSRRMAFIGSLWRV